MTVRIRRVTILFRDGNVTPKNCRFSGRFLCACICNSILNTNHDSLLRVTVNEETPYDVTNFDVVCRCSRSRTTRIINGHHHRCPRKVSSRRFGDSFIVLLTILLSDNSYLNPTAPLRVGDIFYKTFLECKKVLYPGYVCTILH